jgi:hypothetical protein
MLTERNLLVQSRTLRVFFPELAGLDRDRFDPNSCMGKLPTGPGTCPFCSENSFQQTSLALPLPWTVEVNLSRGRAIPTEALIF